MDKTFQDLYTEFQNETGDTNATKLVSFKSWLNRGLAVFQGKLGIMYTREERTTDATANQDRYQKPEDAIRITDIRFNDGARKFPLQLVIDDDKWQWYKTTVMTGTPRLWHPTRRRSVRSLSNANRQLYRRDHTQYQSSLQGYDGR